MESSQFLLLSLLLLLFVMLLLAASGAAFCVRQRSLLLRRKEKLASLGTDTSSDATATYQVRPCPGRRPIRSRPIWSRPISTQAVISGERIRAPDRRPLCVSV